MWAEKLAFEAWSARLLRKVTAMGNGAFMIINVNRLYVWTVYGERKIVWHTTR
jgi:hypothetical protein